MAKLVDIYNCEKEPVIKRRQLPLTIYENLTVSYLVVLWHYLKRRLQLKKIENKPTVMDFYILYFTNLGIFFLFMIFFQS